MNNIQERIDAMSLEQKREVCARVSEMIGKVIRNDPKFLSEDEIADFVDKFDHAVKDLAESTKVLGDLEAIVAYLLDHD